MYEYNYNIDMWYFHNYSTHGKLDTGLWLATPFEISDWFDNEEDYLNKLTELGINTQDEI
jgi:hypothetical protein